MMKSELKVHDLSDRMWFIMKNKLDNNVTNGTGVISIEYNIELLRPIR